MEQKRWAERRDAGRRTAQDPVGANTVEHHCSKPSRLRALLCRLVCRHCANVVFDREASIIIDRLTVRVEELEREVRDA